MAALIRNSSYFPFRTITLNSGGNLLPSSLLPMQKRSGVFLCMEVAGKQLVFSLRSAARENLVILKNYYCAVDSIKHFYTGVLGESRQVRNNISKIYAYS